MFAAVVDVTDPADHTIRRSPPTTTRPDRRRVRRRRSGISGGYSRPGPGPRGLETTAAEVDGRPDPRLLAGVREADDRRGRLDVLVMAQVADRLDVERLLQGLGVAFADPGDGRHRGVEQALEVRVLVLLVQELVQVG